jgi:hypothetical protein
VKICDERQSRLLLLHLQQRCIDSNSFVNTTFLDAGVDEFRADDVRRLSSPPPVAVVIFDCVFSIFFLSFPRVFRKIKISYTSVPTIV